MKFFLKKIVFFHKKKLEKRIQAGYNTERRMLI